MNMRDSFYDIDQAQALASKLVKQRSKIPLPEPRLPDPSPPSEVKAIDPPVAPPEIDFKTEGMYRDQVWEKLLEWAIQSTSSLGGFVCNGSGLVIAESGNMPDAVSNLPSIGVSALASLHRCITTGTAPGTLTAKLDSWWFTLLTLTDNLLTHRMDALLMGLVSETSPRPAKVDRIQLVFRDKLADF